MIVCADRNVQPGLGANVPFVLTLLSVVALLSSCSGDKTAAAANRGPGGRGEMATPVTIARAVQKSIPVQAEVIGTVEPYSTVTMKSQISGQLLKAHFQEGEFVNAGQLMFTVDARPLEAQAKQLEAAILKDQAALNQAQANLVRDRAQESNVKAQAERAGRLWKEGIISKEQYEQFESQAASSAATITADQAAIENSKAQITASKAALDTQKVQLAYTKIYSPISGRTGTLITKPGNIVTANTTELATINQVQPAYVSFALPEAYLGALRRRLGQKLPVQAASDETNTKETGTLSYFENSIDTTTGTIRLKAAFQNPSRNLWPGQFLRVTLKLEDQPNAITVPSQAIQSGQDGTFVFLVKPDQKVDMRPVTAGQRVGDETVVEKGLNAGDVVVTEGTLRLVPGAKVQVREPGAPGGGGRRGGKRS